MYLGFTDRFHAEKVRQLTAARTSVPMGVRGGSPLPARLDTSK